MSALSGVPSKVALRKQGRVTLTQHNRNKHLVESFNSYHYKSFHKAKNFTSFANGIAFDIPLRPKEYITVNIIDQHNSNVKVHWSIILNAYVKYSDEFLTTKKNLTKDLHSVLNKMLKPDPHQVQTIGALPNGLVFKLKGHKFRVGFQYDISGKLNLDLFSENGQAIFDLSNKNGRDAAISYLLGNAGVSSQDPKVYEKQAKEIISEISKELSIANKRIKTDKPIKNIDPDQPGRAPENFIPSEPINKRLKKVVKNKREPIIKNVTPKTTTPGRPTKTQRVNKRGFDVVEKRSITYTRKSPSAKLTGIPLQEGDIVLVKSEKLKAEILNLSNYGAFVEFIDRRPSGGDKRGMYAIKDLKKLGTVNIKKAASKKTTVKKPATAKQLAARAKFTKMVKDRAKAKRINKQTTKK